MLFEAERFRLVMNDAVRYLIVAAGDQEASDNVLIEVISDFIWAVVAKNIISNRDINVEISRRPPYIITNFDESKMKTESGPDIKELKTFYSKLQAYSRLISTERSDIEALLNKMDDFLRVAASILLEK